MSFPFWVEAWHEVRQAFAFSGRAGGPVARSRNICAHHGRLWNRELGVKPLLPSERKHPDWHVPVPMENNRVFCVLTICRHTLARVAPQSHWPARLLRLLADYPRVPQASMGFPSNWQKCPLWKSVKLPRPEQMPVQPVAAPQIGGAAGQTFKKV
jgi:hypothetical protein